MIQVVVISANYHFYMFAFYTYYFSPYCGEGVAFEAYFL